MGSGSCRIGGSPDRKAVLIEVIALGEFSSIVLGRYLPPLLASCRLCSLTIWLLNYTTSIRLRTFSTFTNRKDSI